jgi:hypothetical protein
LSGQSWDTDGDDLMLLTESESHFPMLAFYPATRIGGTGSWPSGPGIGGDSNVVQGGMFDGAKIFDGVIFDRNQRTIGIRINNEDGNFKDVSSFSADLAYLPDWHDQGRGIPRVAVALLRWMSLQDIDAFLEKALKRKASIGVKFKKEEGEAGLGNEIITSEEATIPSTSGPGAEQIESGGDEPRVYFEEIKGGEGYYLNSTTGEDIEEFKYDCPTKNVEEFIARMQRGALASVGWFYELLNLSESGRAASRLVCDLANQSIWDQQSAGQIRAKRAVVYAIAKAMKHGFISRNDDGPDAYKWEFGLPKIISVDAGNDMREARENLKMGMTSHTIEAQKAGYHRNVIRGHRNSELDDLITDATAIHAKHPEVSFNTAMEMLEQRSPNPMMTIPAGKPAPAKAGTPN